MSQLDAIYAAVAGRAITVALPSGATASVTGKVGSTLVDSVESAIMPARLVLPTARGRGAMVTRHTPRTSASAGGVITMDWEIQDVLFLRGADAGIGLRDLAPKLTAYMAQYVNNLGAITTPKWSVTTLNFPVVGTFEWPTGSGRFYDGVVVDLTIREII